MVDNVNYISKLKNWRDLDFYIWLQTYLRNSGNKVKSINTFYDCSTVPFDYEAAPNQIIFIKSIEGLSNDVTIPSTSDITTCKGETFTFQNDLIVEKTNGDQIHRFYSELNNIAVIAVKNNINWRQFRTIAWSVEFENNILT